MSNSNDDKKMEAARVVAEFYNYKKLHEQNEKAFEERKREFEEYIGEYLYKARKTSVAFDVGEDVPGSLVVSRVSTSSIDWDAQKLSQKVERSIAKQLFKKQYTIVDMPGLAQYLKSCGVDPKIFKQYIHVDMEVIEDAIERLGDTGQLTVKQVAGCYKIKQRKPYYTIKVKKRHETE